jgi:glycosyltransferase involved in cell wall biosynthesis
MVSSDATLPVTVVIPAFRRADLVGRAVRSALAQVPPPAEVIVVDDCSGDDTGAVAQAAGATVITHDVNGGQGASRNTGVAAARHEWIAFLDSDDQWFSGHLAQVWTHRDDHVLVGSAGRGSVDGRLYGHPGPGAAIFRTPADVLLPYNRVTPSGALVRRSALDEAGGSRKMRYAEDLDLWIRVLEHGTGIALPTVTFEYFQHDGQVSSDLGKMSVGLDEVVGSFADRPWCSRRVRLAAQAMPRWDQLRAALREGRGRDALRFALPLFHPWRALGLLRLLAMRRRLAARRMPRSPPA